MTDQKNLILAIAASIAILFSFEVIWPLVTGQPIVAPPPAEQVEGESAAPAVPTAESGALEVPAPGGVQSQQPAAAVTAGQTRADLLASTPRVEIETPTLKGSISLIGARLDDLTLRRYRESVEPDSPPIDLLEPPGSSEPYFADFGWIASSGNPALPQADTIWQASHEKLTPEQPVTLSWKSGDGLLFERVFEIDRNYLFTVTQRVVNTSGSAMELAPYGLVSRSGTPETLGFFILHEGLLGVFDGTLKEVDYSDLQDEGSIALSSTGGWIGITDKYWLVALVPDQKRRIDARFVHAMPAQQDKYQTDIRYEPMALPAGGTIEASSRIFAGAKEVTLLDSYRDDLGIERFDRAVDFGWFYFLTKPLFYALDYFRSLIGNYGVSILIVTVLIKLAFFPLANKSYKAMARMRALQPQMQNLRERFGEDRQRLNQEMMALYKREKVNPVSGCLPVVIQIPVFFALYKVLFVTLEMRHAPFFGWIQDLSAQDPTSILNGFGLLPWAVPELGAFNIINLGVWPILMGISMFLQMRLNPQPPDPVQAKIFAFMPFIFTFLLSTFPAGLVIYWTWNNTLSMLQQMVIMKQQGVPIGRNAQAATTAQTNPSAKAAGKTANKSEGAVANNNVAAPRAKKSQQKKKKRKAG